MLEIKQLNAGYGDVHVLKDINMYVNDGELVAVIGANGAGKTTLLKCISGLIKPYSGSITFNGKPIFGAKAKNIVSLGLIQVPEGRLLFPEMSVYENLDLGGYVLSDQNEVSKNLEMVYHLFPILKERSSQLAGTLSGGEQQMVAIGRALMSSPKMIMFDEPSLGLAPIMVKTIFKEIVRINQELNVSALLIEQNVKHSCEVCNRAYVVENGAIVLDGPGCELLQNEHVRRAYMGI